MAYDEKIADEICRIISTSDKGLAAICKSSDNFPSSKTIWDWLNNHEDFRNKYARAREQQAEYLADQIIEISDDSSGDVKINKETGEEYCDNEFVQRSRLRVDARKWKASKLAPKKYGDQLDITSGGEKFLPPQIIITTPKMDDEPKN